jgi:predicted secreted protein
MATFTGTMGVLKVGANTVAEVRNFTITESVEVVDDTVKGDTWRTKKTTFKTWNASADLFWDYTDTTGQGALAVGSEVTIEAYPADDTSGYQYKTGTAIVTELEITSDLEGMVEASATLEGNGALTSATVT